ncbi:MAG: Inner rane component of cytoplasmic domain [Acidobacteriota bacterium]|nr:Inner rane component of cytoplasmic domain [Acidobacteriota bacterium]MDT7778480.1 Inner rane component of cytoplasmic domain [Acidobacteriota bacterium]
MSIIDSIRRWIDGEVSDDPLAEVDEKARPRRVWEEFLVKVAREVEAVMQREMFTPPGGPTYIPPEYVVYLSNDDDKEWQGEKRRGLEQGLYYVLSERAREMSGQTQLATKSFAVELRVDGTLNKGEFRVQPVWESNEQGGHTMVTARPAELQSSDASTGQTDAPADTEAPESEVTKVSVRPTELYSVEIWRNGQRQTVVPITKPEITIGRGSKSVTVDLTIKGDPEVSRSHATLERDNSGRFWFTPTGRNPTFVGGREVPREERVEVLPDQKIDIATFTIRIQPK